MNKLNKVTVGLVSAFFAIGVFGAGGLVGSAGERANTDKAQAQVQTLTKERDAAKSEVKQGHDASMCYQTWGNMLVTVVHNAFVWDLATLQSAVAASNNQLATCEGVDGGDV